MPLDNGVSQYPDHAIAVVGMACKLPGAQSVEELWDIFENGKCMAGEIPESRFPLINHWRSRSMSNMQGNFLEEVDTFDHHFFGKSSREAAAMDPQQRLLMEATYHALEASSYFRAGTPRDQNIGCYIGGFSNDYNDNIASHPTSAYSALGCLKAFQSGRISHFFGWTGPSITYDTACSSSAVAIDSACKDIQLGNCTGAIAGGVAIMTSPHFYQNLGGASFLAEDGLAKPFDATAAGYSRGEGVGVVFLKRLDTALAHGDPVLAVICSSAVRQNSNQFPITAPDPFAQMSLYQQVLRSAQLEPEEVTYVEAHAAGTRIGDCPEYEGIKSVFGCSGRKDPLYITSLKANIGHMEGASGVVALIKIILMMQKRRIPPQANLKVQHPDIKLMPGTMFIPRSTEDWATEPRVACLNNFGASGNIAAMIIKEAPNIEGSSNKDPHDEAQMYPICLSAHSIASLRENCIKLLMMITKQDSQFELADLAFNLSRNLNLSLRYKWNTTAANLPELIGKLQHIQEIPDRLLEQPERLQRARPIVLLLGGQSGNTIQVDKRFYDDCLVFRNHLDECDNVLKAVGTMSIFPGIFEGKPCQNALELHAMIFAFQYSCARTWIDCGLQISRIVGHSIGQLVGLCVTGAVSLHDGAKLIVGRARLIDTQWGSEKGSMLAVGASYDQIQNVLKTPGPGGDLADIEICCYNGPSSYVVAGTKQAIEYFAESLKANQIKHKKLAVTHGFHSRLTEPILDGVFNLAQQLSFRQPEIPLETCTVEQQWDLPTPSLIAEHTREPVYFEAAVQRVACELGPCIWLGAGAETSAVNMAASALNLEKYAEHSFYPVRLGRSPKSDRLEEVTNMLWIEGHNVQFWPFHSTQRGHYRHISLPAYSFAKHRHWLPLKNFLNGNTTHTICHEPRTELLYMNKVQRTPADGTIFEINLESPEWAALVDEHAIFDKGVCPVSLYTDIVCRASQQLSHDKKEGDRTTFYILENVDILRPVGRYIEGTLSLALKARPESGQIWEFFFYVNSTGRDPRSMQIAMGVIRLAHEEDDIMVGFHRASKMLDLHSSKLVTPDANCTNILEGPVIYQLLSRVVHYGQIYRVIQSIRLSRDAAIGQLVLPETCGRFSGTPILSPIAVEGFLQVAAIHVNLFGPKASSGTLSMCTGIKYIQPTVGLLRPSSESSWTVSARASSDADGVVEYDILVFCREIGQPVLVIYGAKYAQVSTHRIQQIMSRSVWDTEGMESHKASISLPIERTSFQRTSRTVSRDSPMSKYALQKGLEKIFYTLLGTPVEGFSATTSFNDLGVDSLMMTEIQHAIKQELDTDVVSSQLLGVKTFQELLNLLYDQVCSSSRSDHQSCSRNESIDSTYQSSTPSKTKEDETLRLHRLIENHLGPLSPIHPSTTLRDLGVDSLLYQELIADIEKEFTTSVDTRLISIESTFAAICSSVGMEVRVGRPQGESSPARPPHTIGLPIGHAQQSLLPPQRVFLEKQKSFTRFAAEASWLGFWQKVYPLQSRLVLAYILEAFVELGCDLSTIARGKNVPWIDVTPRNEKLKSALYEILRDGELIDSDGDDGGYIRSDKPLQIPPSHLLYDEVLKKHPQHVKEHELLKVTGPKLAKFLRGDEDPLKFLFGNPDNRRLLEDVYAEAPMFRTMNLMLCDFLGAFLRQYSNDSPIHILELGAGTGGTTKSVVGALTNLGVPFVYTFSDISSSLVMAAKRSFAALGGSMEFIVLDIEKMPPMEYFNRFHVVISTNCLHGTRDLATSLGHVKQMLRPAGFMCLIELTKRLFWLDLVFGLVEGWWLFQDGRTHALASPAVWERCMLSAGFEQALMTNGSSTESQTVRLVCGFTAKCDTVEDHPKPKELDFETILYKADRPHLYADVYYPSDPEAHGNSTWPIALLVHGGGHIMLSRKHIRHHQVQLLLDNGIIPVSIDYRLCPEVSITDGPLCDVRDAFKWARTRLPLLSLKHRNIRLDGERVGVVGWSSGGTLALSLGWSAMAVGVRPPEAIVTFYCPTDYEDEFWKNPQPLCEEQDEDAISSNVLEGVQDEPIAAFLDEGLEGDGSHMSSANARSRIYLHMARYAQTLPILANGLPSLCKVPSDQTQSFIFQQLPPVEKIREFSPYAQMTSGRYTTPTYLIHGKKDELVPWQQAWKVYKILKDQNVPTGVAMPDDDTHLFDLHAGQSSHSWKIIRPAYEFLFDHLRSPHSRQE